MSTSTDSMFVEPFTSFNPEAYRLEFNELDPKEIDPEGNDPNKFYKSLQDAIKKWRPNLAIVKFMWDKAEESLRELEEKHEAESEEIARLRLELAQIRINIAQHRQEEGFDLKHLSEEEQIYQKWKAQVQKVSSAEYPKKKAALIAEIKVHQGNYYKLLSKLQSLYDQLYSMDNYPVEKLHLKKMYNQSLGSNKALIAENEEQYQTILKLIQQINEYNEEKKFIYWAKMLAAINDTKTSTAVTGIVKKYYTGVQKLRKDVDALFQDYSSSKNNFLTKARDIKLTIDTIKSAYNFEHGRKLIEELVGNVTRSCSEVSLSFAKLEQGLNTLKQKLAPHVMGSTYLDMMKGLPLKQLETEEFNKVEKTLRELYWMRQEITLDPRSSSLRSPKADSRDAGLVLNQFNHLSPPAGFLRTVTEGPFDISEPKPRATTP